MPIDKKRFTKYYSIGAPDFAVDDALWLCMSSRVVYIRTETDYFSLKRVPEDLEYRPEDRGFYMTSVGSADIWKYINPGDLNRPHLLRDIQVENQEPGKFAVSFFLEPCTEREANPGNPKSMHPQHTYLEILHKKLFNLKNHTGSASDTIGGEIPFWFDGGVDRKRQLFLTAKLLFLLAGEVEIHEVDDLQMLSLAYIEKHREELEYLKDEYAMTKECNRDDPVLPASDLPSKAQIKQRIPRTMSIGRLISLFGLYVHGECPKIGRPQISYCPNNIYRFAAWAETSKSFTKYLFPLESLNSEAFGAFCYVLENVTLAHELGHHVFRQVQSDTDTEQDKETLANWLASVLLGDYERKLIRELSTKLPAKYSNVIQLPGQAFTEKKYVTYCEKVLALMKEVGK